MSQHPVERPELLVAYLESTSDIELVLGELSEDQLESRERPGEWSVRQIVHHLADNEVADAMRLRQMLAHDSPLIVPFDELLFTERLHYDREIESSLATFFALRSSSGAILEQVSDGDWSRSGRHEEHDSYTVEILVQKNIEHDRAHLEQIQRALEEGVADRSAEWTDEAKSGHLTSSPSLSSRTSSPVGLDAWFALFSAGTILLIAAFALPVLSISFGDLGSANATLEELASRLEAGRDGFSQGTEIAWRFGWATIAFAALAALVGIAGWFRVVRFYSSVPATLLIAGVVLFVMQWIGVILLTAEADAGSGIVFGTSGFWVNAIAFAAILGSLWGLCSRTYE